MSEGFSVKKAKGDWFISLLLLVMFGVVVALGLLLSWLFNRFFVSSTSHAYLVVAVLILILIINFWKGDEK